MPSTDEFANYNPYDGELFVEDPPCMVCGAPESCHDDGCMVDGAQDRESYTDDQDRENYTA